LQLHVAAKGDLVQYWQYKCENVVDLCFSQDAQMTREDVGALWRLADADGKIHRLSKIFQIQSEKDEKKSKEIKRIQKDN
jgi:hypothetical protein